MELCRPTGWRDRHCEHSRCARLLFSSLSPEQKMKFAAVRRFDLQTGVDEELVAPDVYDVFWVGELGNRALLYATDMRRYGNVETPVFTVWKQKGRYVWRIMTKAQPTM